MYKITLTRSEIGTIYFVGHRYGWSDILTRNLVLSDKSPDPEEEGEGPFTYELSEPDAWEWNEAVDGEGLSFPMLRPGSSLHSKLMTLWESIV